MILVFICQRLPKEESMVEFKGKMPLGRSKKAPTIYSTLEKLVITIQIFFHRTCVALASIM